MSNESPTADDVAEATALHVWSVSLNCPHCHKSQDGWLIDPRDKDHECDDCGKPYRVSQDIRLWF